MSKSLSLGVIVFPHEACFLSENENKDVVLGEVSVADGRSLMSEAKPVNLVIHG